MRRAGKHGELSRREARDVAHRPAAAQPEELDRVLEANAVRVPEHDRVGAAIAPISSSGHEYVVVSSSVSFSTSRGKSPGFGASFRYASSIGDPANIAA